MTPTPRTDAVKERVERARVTCNLEYSQFLLQMVGALTTHARELEVEVRMGHHVADALGRQVQYKDDDRIYWRDTAAVLLDALKLAAVMHPHNETFRAAIAKAGGA